MSDLTVRQRERDYRQSGRTDAGAAFLSALWRAGELSEADLRFGAYAQVPEAVMAVEVADLAGLSDSYREELSESGDHFAAWFAGVSDWGKDWAFRVVLWCVDMVMERSSELDPRAERLRDLLEVSGGQREALSLAKRCFADLEDDRVSSAATAALWALATATEFFLGGEVWRGAVVSVAEHAALALKGRSDDPEGDVLRFVREAAASALLGKSRDSQL